MNPVRLYFRFSDALTEVGEAWIYGGMHYRNSTRPRCEHGKAGFQVYDETLLPSVEQRRRQTEPIVK